MILSNTVQSFKVKIVGLSGREIGLSSWSFFSWATYLYDVEIGTPVSFVIVGASRTPQP
jgi:hypothetical protein